MPKSFLVRNPRRNPMTVTDMTTCDPAWDRQAMKTSTDNHHLSASMAKDDLRGSPNRHVVARDDLQSRNDLIDDTIEPLNLSCRSGYDLRGDSATNSEEVEPLDLHVPSKYHQHRLGLGKPKGRVGLSTGVRPQYHSSMVEKGEEGAVEGTQPYHRPITSQQMNYHQGIYNANHDVSRPPSNRHPPEIDSLLRRTLERRSNSGNFFSHQLVAIKLRSPSGSGDSSKRHCCCFCSKQFNDKFDLKRHLRTHTGVRPFKCDRCFRAFTQRCSLEIHQKKIHNMELNFAFKERRGKVYVCEHCGHSTNEINTHYAHSVQEHRGLSGRFPDATCQVAQGLVSGAPVWGKMPRSIPVSLKQETQPYPLCPERAHVPKEKSTHMMQGMHTF